MSTTRDPNLTKHGKPRCEAQVMPAHYGWRETRCAHPAKMTIDGKALCGTHARQVIKTTQYAQRGAFVSVTNHARDAQRAREHQRANVMRALLDGVEEGLVPDATFATAREALAEIDVAYAERLAIVIARYRDAHALNVAREFSLADDDDVVVGARAAADTAQRWLDERSTR